MASSMRKAATEKFRREIRRSNELHDSYLSDPQFLKDYDRFTHWQLSYLLPFFSDLHSQEGYAEAINFTMSDLAGVGISGRDRDLERAAPVITRMLPLRALATIAAAAEMNATVLRINTAICRCLLVDNKLPDEIAEIDYCLACRRASSFEECAELVYLSTRLGTTLKSLVKIPVLGATLRAMRGPAHAAGFGALQDFLEKGFSTFRQIPDIDFFLDEVEVRMVRMFELIYSAPLDELRKPGIAIEKAPLIRGN